MEFAKLALKIMGITLLILVIGGLISYPAALLFAKAEETGSVICYIGVLAYIVFVVGLGTAIMVWRTDQL
jgi:hypothetical protein